MKKLTYLQKLYYFLLGILFPLLISIPIAGYLAGLYLFTDMTKLKKEYPVWALATSPEGRTSNENWQIEWKTQRPKNWISLRDVSKEAQQAILVSEDGKFYQHFGIDMDSLYEVVKNFVDSGGQSRLRGASTISQQVVKNLFFDNERSYWRKIKELILTIKMERSLEKREIFEIYLNIAQWGKEIHGISTAANLYFKKSPRELNYKEGAFLAMLLPNPIQYAISYYKKSTTKYARGRMRQIIYNLYLARWIDEATYRYEIQRPLPWEFFQSSASLSLPQENEANSSADNKESIDTPTEEEESLPTATANEGQENDNLTGEFQQLKYQESP